MKNFSSQQSSQGPGASTNTTSLPFGGDYTEFYLTALWTFKSRGIQRVLSSLKALNVEHALYSFEHEFFKVRCKTDDVSFIQRNFRKIQDEIEAELRTPGGFNVPDVMLTQEVKYADVQLRDIVGVPLSPAFHSSLPADDRDGRDTNVILEVPDELRDYPAITAWQQLQNSQVFGTAFLPPRAVNKIEQAYAVKLVVDHGQKVIFIGAPADRGETAEQVKGNINNLLRDFMMHQILPPNIARHIFHVDSASPWAIDLREITQVHPDLGRSSIFSQPTTYAIFLQQPVFRLRACLEEPLRSGLRNKLWSLFGPRNQSGPEPRLVPLLFKDPKCSSRRRIAPPTANEGGVTKWLDGVAMPTLAKQADNAAVQAAARLIPLVQSLSTKNPPGAAAHSTAQAKFDEDEPIQLDCDPGKRRGTTMHRCQADGPATSDLDGAVKQLPAGNIDEDAPIQLHFDPSKRRINLPCDDKADGPGAGLKPTAAPVRKEAMKTSILDKIDPALQDPTSSLQRPLAPLRRTIIGQDPDRLPAITPTSSLEDARIGTELERLVASLRLMMQGVRWKDGLVDLRAELGRYYTYDVPSSAWAHNSPNEPSNGWDPQDIRARLESRTANGQASQKYLFTTALSCWGSDADYLAELKLPGGKQMWLEKSKTTYFDVLCQVRHRGQTAMAVLEIDSEDFSWTIRGTDDTRGRVFVHCLTQHWDFQIRLSHAQSQENALDEYVQSLVDSVEVFPAADSEFCLGYRRSIEDILTVEQIRVRQVARFQQCAQQKIFMDISRILPTSTMHRNGEYARVSTIPKGFIASPGVVSQWIEASLSSARLEDALKRNEQLIPGEEADWTVDQLSEDFQVLYESAADLVKRINGVGVNCDNGVLKSGIKTGTAKPKTDFKW